MKHEDTVLAVVAGFVDTLGFVALFGLFTAHVTGNFVLIGAEAAGLGQGVLMKLLAFPAFIAGVALSSAVVRARGGKPPATAARPLYALQAVLLAGFLVAGLYAAPVRDAQAPAAILCGLLGAVAMGVQNAHARLVGRPGVPNTVMTGNVTQAVLDTLDALLSHPDAAARRIARERLMRTLGPLAGFGIGAIAGATTYVRLSFGALALPLALIVWLAFRSGAGAPATESRDAAR
ncbi:YoaK family protein [Cupriavidus basilensis]|uniref:YoaK family protein n=1 Tax=Cupriavidus basilensis TaxID=68895 RepID=UPI000750AFF1|nr:YoaK family protein [Cupriavidus basilensis]